MYRSNLCLVLLALLSGTSALGTPYWIAWEGDGFPEDQGWTRVWGNWDGQYQGLGAIRTLQDGVLTYDSLYDNGVCDFSKMYRPGHMDPGPGEVFVMEWRLRVDRVDGWITDPGVSISSDDAWCLGFGFGPDHVYSLFEDFAGVALAVGVFHSYRVVSGDMRQYDLYIDGQWELSGAFRHLVGASDIGWGDDVQGAGSVHHWDYFRFGVVPEASPGMLVVVLCVCFGGRHR